MHRGLCWGSLVVAALLTLLFLLDLFIAFPFQRASWQGWACDIFGIIAGGFIIYLCWDTLKELPK